MSSTSPTARLNLASQTLRDALQQLTAAQATEAPALGGLLRALGQYEQAVRACLPPVDIDILGLTPAQLLAYREADPIYRLGWVRGHKVGLAQGQHQATEPLVKLYAQHAALPLPPDPSAIIEQVRRTVAYMQQRYGAGPITPATAARPI